MLTPPFADTTDLADRWRPLTLVEQTRAATLLDDASQLILDEDKRGVLVDLAEPTLTAKSATLKRVVCKIVERAMGAPVDAQAVAQYPQSLGPFTDASPTASPSGDLYLTKAERRQLGFSRQRAGSVAMWAEPVVAP